MNFFRNLDKEEVKEFQQWAQDNYVPGEEIKGIWHPAVQEECVKINREKLGVDDNNR